MSSQKVYITNVPTDNPSDLLSPPSNLLHHPSNLFDEVSDVVESVLHTERPLLLHTLPLSLSLGLVQQPQLLRRFILGSVLQQQLEQTARCRTRGQERTSVTECAGWPLCVESVCMSPLCVRAENNDFSRQDEGVVCVMVPTFDCRHTNLSSV